MSGTESVPETAFSGEGPVLQIYEAGLVTVVGFNGRDVPDEVCIAGFRQQLVTLVKQHQCETLVFDCAGVTLMPSGMLGLLTTLRKQVSTIELRNPSKDFTEVLAMTNLAPFFVITQTS